MNRTERRRVEREIAELAASTAPHRTQAGRDLQHKRRVIEQAGVQLARQALRNLNDRGLAPRFHLDD